MDGGAWWAAVHGIAQSRTRLSDFTFTFHLHALEKEMATHPSALAWRIPGTGEPGGLPSTGSHRVGHDRGDSAAAAAKESRERSHRGRSIRMRSAPGDGGRGSRRAVCQGGSTALTAGRSLLGASRRHWGPRRWRDPRGHATRRAVPGSQTSNWSRILARH